jgi:periplasmic divalent cation tolerance protein
MTDTEFRFVYVTAPNKQVALEIGRAMVELRLAACANVLDGMTSSSTKTAKPCSCSRPTRATFPP